MKEDLEKRVANLRLEEVLQRTLENCASDIEPLMEYLRLDLPNVLITETPNGWHPKMSGKDKAREIALTLRKMGSNDIATFLRSGEPVEYGEVVFDVGGKLKADVSRDKSTFDNEKEIIKKIFADTLDKMSVEEKKELFKSMNIDVEEVSLGETGVLLTQVLLKNFGGFTIYKIALIVANAVARQILGHGLKLATNALIARSISIFIGPIGWVLTGIWLLIDIAGPAYRKTVPAVIYIAALRLMLLYRINIGVVGDGATGKDAMMKCVFNIDTGNISPIAGTTSSKEIYALGPSGAFITNFPGFNDYRPKVDKDLDDYLCYMDAFILIVDISRGLTNTDIDIFNNVKALQKPTLVCLNKIDLPRTENDKNTLIKAAKKRIKAAKFCETAFDPDPRLHKGGPIGCKEVYEWVCLQIERDEKDTSNIPKGNF